MTRLRSAAPFVAPTFTRTALFGVCVLSGGAALWVARGAPVPVVDAAVCPGLLELTATGIALARPALAMATPLIVMHHVSIVAAAAICALAAWRLTRLLLVSAAVGVVAASSTAMLPTLAPSSAAALAIAAATWSAIIGRDAGSQSASADSMKPSLVAVITGMTTASAIAPSFGLPTALLVWWSTRRRAGHLVALATASASLAVAVGVGFALPPLPGMPATASLRCVIPWGVSLSAAANAAIVQFGDVGLFTLALAAVGVFSAAFELGRERLALAFGWVAASFLAALWPGADPLRTLAPVLVAIWLLAGRGLAETIHQAGSGWRRAAATVVFIAVFVGVNVAPRLRPPPTAAEPPVAMGHEHLARRDVRTLLSQLPADAALVDEDAVTDILLRSLSGGLHRAGVALQIVPRSNEAVAAARASRRVFALPRAQADLQARGVRFVEGLMPAVPGVAEVAAVVPCDTTDDSWRTAISLPGAAVFALVADSESTRGPLVVYVGGLSPLEASPHAWPPLALRGFYARRYDKANADGRLALAQEVANDAAPPQHAALSAPHVSRIELWRVPGAPRALMVQLSSQCATAVIQQLPKATGRLLLCQAFPFARHALAPPAGTRTYR